MKIFVVTGASGLIGTNLLRELDKKNDVKIIAFVNKSSLHYTSDKIKQVKCNILDKENINLIFSKYSEFDEKFCIHCAGIISIKSKNNNEILNVNINGTKNIVEICTKYNYKLVYVSSVDAMEKPPIGQIVTEPKLEDFYSSNLKGIYGKTKAKATSIILDACKSNNLKASIVFPSAIIGPYDYNKGNFTSLIEMYTNNKLPAIIKGGYDFVDVRDVVYGIISIIDKNKFNECYLLTNKYYTVKELIDTLAKVTNGKKVKIIMPTWFVKIVSPLFEFYSVLRKEKPLFTPYSIFVLHTNSNFSHEKASKDLEYNPRNLKEVLTDTYKWIKENS